MIIQVLDIGVWVLGVKQKQPNTQNLTPKTYLKT